MFGKSTLTERRKYYREEWSIKDVPEFILEEIQKKEFGFDHNGTGPNDRYNSFKGPQSLRRYLRAKAPFASYVSVAYYNEPRRREGWNKAEYVFDVDAKDLPIRSCNCDNVCETCLSEALEIVNNLIDTLKSDLGLKNIHLIYSGRGYHIRILDENMVTADSNLRSEVLKYAAGAIVPDYNFPGATKSEPMPHFRIPIGYPKIFTKRLEYDIMHLTGNEKIDGINRKLLKDIIKNRDQIKKGEWGVFKAKIGPRRYNNLQDGLAKLNLATIDAKVSIDLKRILRLPSSLHSKVSMKCVEVKNRETFNPLKSAVPKFVYEREE